jgi:protoporphyrinogen IX oxidase
MWLLFFKTLHIIGAVSWFAGLLYLGRMFVYHREAQESNNKQETAILTKQYSIMEWRVSQTPMNPSPMIT